MPRIILITCIFIVNIAILVKIMEEFITLAVLRTSPRKTMDQLQHTHTHKHIRKDTHKYTQLPVSELFNV